MPTPARKQVSSGITQLDTLLGGLYIGDNVLWYEEAGNFSSVFCQNFIRHSLTERRPTVYVSFDRSPKNVLGYLGPLAESQHFTILDCFTNGKGDGSEVFNKFYEKDGAQWPYQVIRVNEPGNPQLVAEAIYGLHSSLVGNVRYIIDSLTGMQDLWGGEEPLLRFYARSCPRLYELDTIAYWIVEKAAHSSRLQANINKIAQVAVDLSVKNGKPALTILKAEKRETPFLNEAQIFSCQEMVITFDLPRFLPGRYDLGGRIRSLRKQQGLSQKELAERTGVTPSSISQVEKNSIFPSLPALFRMADSLAVEVGAFFQESGRAAGGCVFSGGQGGSLPFTKAARGLIEGQQLLPAEGQAGGLQLYRLTMAPGKKLAGHFFHHKGSELGYLLAGQLRLQVQGHLFTAAAGDTISLPRETPESWENLGPEPAELLWLTIS